MAAAECREESGGALGIISKRSGAVANRIPAPEPQNQQISRQPVTKKSTNEGVDCKRHRRVFLRKIGVCGFV